MTKQYLNNEKTLYGLDENTQSYGYGEYLGETHLSCRRKGGAVSESSEALYLTGNSQLRAYSSDMMVEDMCLMEKNWFGAKLKGNELWSVPTSTESHTAEMLALLEYFSAKEWFEQFFKNFPLAAKYYDQAAQEEIWGMFKQAIAVSHDDKKCADVVRDWYLKMYETKYLRPNTLWRMSEALMESMLKASWIQKTSQHVVKLTIEKITKIMINQLATAPWAHKMLLDTDFVAMSHNRDNYDAGIL
jgi:hypothetical protein